LSDDQHYLNGAYLSPLLKAVERAGIAGIREKRNPWKITAEDFFEDSEKLRKLFAELVNADCPNKVAILPSASYGLSTVAQNLPKDTGKKIVVVGEQFPSNIYPWRRFCKESSCYIQTIEEPDSFSARGQKWNNRILSAINDETLMVAVANIHWADGTLFNLEEIGKRCREVNAYLVIDGTQSVGALPFDVQKVQP